MTLRPPETGDQKNELCEKRISDRGLLFKSGVQMNADADQSDEERIMLFRMYLHAVQSVIIQDTVVDPFSRCALAVGFFISLCATWDIGI